MAFALPNWGSQSLEPISLSDNNNFAFLASSGNPEVQIAVIAGGRVTALTAAEVGFLNPDRLVHRLF